MVVFAIGLALLSIATPLTSARILERWFSLPNFLWLSPLPLGCAGLLLFLWTYLSRLPLPDDRGNWIPFAGAAATFVLGFIGLTYSFYPYIIPERLTLVEAASANESLMIILIGAVIVLPMIIGYTVFTYRVFAGKASPLTYH